MSRPQAKYFLYYPCLLAGAALLLWIEPTNLMTGIASGVGALVGCLMMWAFLFTDRVLRLSRVCAMGLVIGYGAGTLNSWLTLTQGPFPLALAAGETVPEMANGVAAALMGCAVLLALGELFETPVLRVDEEIPITRRVKYVIYVTFSIVLVAVAAGKFHQGGVKTASVHHAGFLAVFLSFLVVPTIVLATIAALVETEKRSKYLFSGISVFLWILQVTQGRRELVYPALITIGLARYFGYKWGRLSWKRVLLLVGGIAFLFVGVLTFQLLRLAGHVASSEAISAEGHQVGKWVQQGRAWKIATTSSIQNVKTRTLIVTFLDDMLYREKTKPAAHGKDLLLQFEMAIPSVIYPDKPTIVEEVVASRTFDIFYTDQANSLFTAGALDFGLLGMLVYPIVALLLFSAFLRFVKGQFPWEVFLFSVPLFLSIAIAAETNLTSYFSAPRDVLVFAAFIYVIARLPVFRWNSGERRIGWQA